MLFSWGKIKATKRTHAKYAKFYNLALARCWIHEWCKTWRKVAEQFWNGQCQWAHIQQLKENKIWQSVKVKNIKEELQLGGKSVGLVMQEHFSPCRNKMWGCVSSKALANCGACDVHLYNTVGLMAVHSLCSLHLQTGLPSLSRPPPPWSALCLCPAPRRTSGRSCYVN